MRVYTIAELLPLTRNQLLELLRSISAELAMLPEASPDWHAAQASLTNLKAVLSRRARATPGAPRT